MLRISKLTDYGTLILSHMAGTPDRVFSAAGLAEAHGLGLPTVSNVLKTHGRHELVTSQRGAHGGYSLSRPATRISVADVIDALEEHPFGLTECSASSGVCCMEADCRIRQNWLRINAVVRTALQSVSLADMVDPHTRSPFGSGAQPGGLAPSGRIATHPLALAACIPHPRPETQEPTS